jgi:hypothetical protein
MCAAMQQLVMTFVFWLVTVKPVEQPAMNLKFEAPGRMVVSMGDQFKEELKPS